MLDNFCKRWVLSTLQSKVVYIGLFLDVMSQKKLIKVFGQQYPSLFADHVTLWFYSDHKQINLKQLQFGKTYPIKIIEYVVDNKAQVVVVKTPIKNISNKKLHITISTDNVPPVYAKSMVEHTPKKIIKNFPTLKGRLGWSDGLQVKYSPII